MFWYVSSNSSVFVKYFVINSSKINRGLTFEYSVKISDVISAFEKHIPELDKENLLITFNNLLTFKSLIDVSTELTIGDALKYMQNFK